MWNHAINQSINARHEIDEKLCQLVDHCERTCDRRCIFLDSLVSRLRLVQAPPVRDQDTTSNRGEAGHHYHGNKMTIRIFL